jgi:BolA family transcriptional regulator, general stress-responsive regulator
MKTKIDRIKSLIDQELHPDWLEVLDESFSHRNHLGYRSDGSHFAIRIKNSAFDNVSRVQSHRLIYKALSDMFPQEIHALRIEIL